MALATFPTLKGESYPVVRRPIFSTIVSTASSGLEVRIGNYLYPLSEWDIPFDWLSQADAIADFQTLYGLFVQNYGQFAPMLYNDPTDNKTSQDPLHPTPSEFALADGITTAYQIGRRLGGGFEPLFDINPAFTPVIYLNNFPLSGGYTISPTGLVTFGSPPSVGTTLKADFQYFWRVRFGTDEVEFNNFASQLWESKKITLRQVRV